MRRRIKPFAALSDSHIYLAALCLNLFGAGSIQDQTRILREINTRAEKSNISDCR